MLITHGRLVTLSSTVVQIASKGVVFLLKLPVEGSVRTLWVISCSPLVIFLYEEKIRLRMKVASYKVMM